MNYVFKQKFHFSELAPVDSAVPKVLVFEPEDYLGGLYKHHLTKHRFEVRHCANHQEIEAWLQYFQPELVVFSLDAGMSIIEVKKLFKKTPEIKIITTAYNAPAEHLKDLMSFGIMGHINRRFSRPGDLVTLAKTLFYN